MAGIIEEKSELGDSSTTMALGTENNVLAAEPSIASGNFSALAVDPAVEKQALKKFDLYLLPQLSILTVLAYLDRTNIGA